MDPGDLNKALKRPKYQMPTLEELLPKLGKGMVLSTLDAKDGLYKIALDEEMNEMKRHENSNLDTVWRIPIQKSAFWDKHSTRIVRV